MVVEVMFDQPNDNLTIHTILRKFYALYHPAKLQIIKILLGSRPHWNIRAPEKQKSLKQYIFLNSCTLHIWNHTHARAICNIFRETWTRDWRLKSR